MYNTRRCIILYHGVLLLLTATTSTDSIKCSRIIEGTTAPRSHAEGKYHFYMTLFNRTEIVYAYMPNTRYSGKNILNYKQEEQNVDFYYLLPEMKRWTQLTRFCCHICTYKICTYVHIKYVHIKKERDCIWCCLINYVVYYTAALRCMNWGNDIWLRSQSKFCRSYKKWLFSFAWHLNAFKL